MRLQGCSGPAFHLSFGMASNLLAYRNEFVPATNEQLARWEIVLPAGARLPTLAGRCLTCHDECEVEILDVVAHGGVPSAAADDQPMAELTRQIICNCRVNHEWPAGVRAGCGRHWFVRLTLQQDGTYHLAPENDLRLLPAATALNEAHAVQHKRIQGAAEKWLGAVTAIYGLFSLTGIATAKDALTGLSTDSRWLVASALLAGLAAATVSLIFGYRAAYGWPRPVKVDDNEKLRKWYDDYRNSAVDAARQLQVAVFSAMASLAAITVLTMLVWFLPKVTA
jgi:hypothetical protein